MADLADVPGAARSTIADMIQEAIRTHAPLPDPQDVRARITVGVPIDTVLTVGQFLLEWIDAKKDLKANTRRSYRQQITQYLIPAIGHHRLDRLRAAHVQAALDRIAQDAAAIETTNAARHAVEAEARQAWRTGDRAAAQAARAKLVAMPPFRRPAGPATVQRIRACLRSALTDAQKQQLVTVNVAKLVNLRSGRRPKPKVWTDARVTAWREDGQIPGPVMVWTAPQTTAFLARAASHRSIRFTRSSRTADCAAAKQSACAGSTSTSPPAKSRSPSRSCNSAGRLATDDTKSESGDRTVIAPLVVLKAIAVHRKKQAAARLACGEDWQQTGLVFTDDHGASLHPDYVLEQFQRLVREAGLPPIRLHDLRHGAATLALTAGVPMKTVSEMLGHASITITADTYTSVVDEARRVAADAIADQLAA
ncbi:site-specific integrase [Actinocrinis puniceicyclus]|uniref:Site-specific integrase n=1 Tax=Actinocrinis puniceicyclus TaxID=977794 RepID=A0A8J8BBG8_9ACTN|nr:site-specific integrase [Actinocrinis puniceicyclus]MBS2962061.1 site-specific integrase [Actinocrinis puniceicyclus]